MKKLLFAMGIVILLMLQSNPILSSNPQSEGMTDRIKKYLPNWLWSMWSTNEVIQPISLRKSYEKNIPIVGSVAFMQFFLDGIDNKNVNIKNTRYLLYGLISNEKLYPTYLSKLNALTKKDDFIKDDFSPMLNTEAKRSAFNVRCNEIANSMQKERSALESKMKEEKWKNLYYYGKTKEEWQKHLDKEKEIDTFIEMFEKSIVSVKDLPRKFIALEDVLKDITKEFNESRFIAWLSVYSRLKNKLENSRIISVKENLASTAKKFRSLKAPKNVPAGSK